MTATPDAVNPTEVSDVGNAGGAAEDLTAAPSKPMELAFAIGMLALGLAMFVEARAIHVRNETGGMDPRTWPMIIAACIIASAAWTLFNAVTNRRAERDVDRSTRTGWVQLAITVGMILVVLVLWEVGLSFLILAPLFIIVCNIAYGLRGIIALVVFPATLTGILFAVFQLLLKVPL